MAVPITDAIPQTTAARRKGDILHFVPGSEFPTDADLQVMTDKNNKARTDPISPGQDFVITKNKFNIVEVDKSE